MKHGSCSVTGLGRVQAVCWSGYNGDLEIKIGFIVGFGAEGGIKRDEVVGNIIIGGSIVWARAVTSASCSTLLSLLEK